MCWYGRAQRAHAFAFAIARPSASVLCFGMATKKALASAALGAVEPLCQVAAYDAKLLVLLMDASRARLWNGSGGDSERSSAVANSDTFIVDHGGWVLLGAERDANESATLLSLDDETGTLDIYRLAHNRLALFGPGHTQLEAMSSSPRDARERIFARLAAGPSAEARAVGQFTIQSELMVFEHNLDTSDLAPKTLRLGSDASFKVVDDSGSALVHLPPDPYHVLLEPAALPWRENSTDRIAFIVPSSDALAKRAERAKLAR